jgi:hypothetical protein
MACRAHGPYLGLGYTPRVIFRLDNILRATTSNDLKVWPLIFVNKVPLCSSCPHSKS